MHHQRRAFQPKSAKRRPSSRQARPSGERPRSTPPAQRQKRQKNTRRTMQRMVILALALVLIGGGLCLLMVAGGVGVLYGSGDVLPGVSVSGVDLGSKSETEAAATLTDVWNTTGLFLRDGDRTWTVSPADLGVTLDAVATARAAHAWGRDNGGLPGGFQALFSGVNIEPVLRVDLTLMSSYLTSVVTQIELPAQDAGVQLVGGQAAARPASEGRTMDIPATVDLMRLDAAHELADGALDLVMIPTYPSVTDVTPLVAEANALLARPFTINAYDPIRDDLTTWSAPPETWAAWLTAQPDPASPTGLALALHAEGPTTFLRANGQFADERYINIDDAVGAMQAAMARRETAVTVRVWHNETSYTVSSGQTLAAIAEEIGIPYPYIQAANPGINADALVVGQSLVIPSRDVMVPLEPNPHKRIIVSRSQQHLWAYENGQLVYDWVISTGLPTSPTALGVFQIQTHELNAYGEQWNLYMPHFMGFYHPGPNVVVMNGFHGFPTRGGGYLLWSGDLGHPVTYGCVLLSLENAAALYNWAEDGVVVEVQA